MGLGGYEAKKQPVPGLLECLASRALLFNKVVFLLSSHDREPEIGPEWLWWRGIKQVHLCPNNAEWGPLMC